MLFLSFKLFVKGQKDSSFQTIKKSFSEIAKIIIASHGPLPDRNSFEWKEKIKFEKRKRNIWKKEMFVKKK
jgi:hypothetical protein